MPKRTPAVKAVARLQPTVRAKGEPFLDILETTVFLAVTPRRDLSRNNRYERRATIAGSNRVRKIASPQLL
jgi:hypothetical protein